MSVNPYTAVELSKFQYPIFRGTSTDLHPDQLALILVNPRLCNFHSFVPWSGCHSKGRMESRTNACLILIAFHAQVSRTPVDLHQLREFPPTFPVASAPLILFL